MPRRRGKEEELAEHAELALLLPIELHILSLPTLQKPDPNRKVP